MSRVFIHSENLSNVHLFALANNIAVLRGTFKPSPPGGSEFDEFASWRDERGLPRWTDIRGCQAFWETRGKGKTIALGDEAESDEALLGTHEEAGLREWCERYCGDPGLLKEFRMRKAIWGWDFSALTAGMWNPPDRAEE